jgi:prephenate dehydrogenase
MAKVKPKAGIIGAGVMGSHMAGLCRKLFDVSLFDIDREVALKAANENRCAPAESAEKLVGDSDLTIFAVPTDVVGAEIRRLSRLAPDGSCMTDVTSVKKMPMDAFATSVRRGVSYYGMHPNYRATIDPYGQTVVMCPGKPAEGCRYQLMVEDTFKRKGAHIEYMSPEEADFYSDVNQALAHDSYLGFMGVLMAMMEDGSLDMKKMFATSTPNSKRLLENAGRMLGGKPHVYGGIQLFKSGSVGMIDRMVSALMRQKELLVGRDGRKPTEEAMKDFKQHFLQLRAVLGDSFVRDACTRTDSKYEVPGGVQVYYPTQFGFAGDIEDFLRSHGAKTFRQHYEQVKVSSIPSGSLGKVSRQYALAKARLHRYECADKEGATAFFCSNRRLSGDKKGIRFTAAPIIIPDKVRELDKDDLYEFVTRAIRTSDERNPSYDVIQLSGRYDDPVLRFYDTVQFREDLSALGPWLVSSSRN